MRKLLAVSLLLIACSGMVALAQSEGQRAPSASSTATAPLPARKVIKTQRAEVARIVGHDRKAVEGARVLAYILEFNSDGKPVEERMFNPDGTPRGRRSMKYNERGRPVEDASYDAAGALVRRAVRSYERREVVSGGTRAEFERVSDEKIYGAGERLIERSVFNYEGERRDPSEILAYDAGGALVRRTVSTIEPQTGRRVWSRHKADGTLEGRDVYKSEEAEGRREVTRYNADGTLERRAVYKDTEWGSNLTEYDAAGAVRRERLATELDAEGNVIKEVESRLNPATGKLERISVTYYAYTFH